MNVLNTFIKQLLIFSILAIPIAGFGQLEFYEVIADEGFEYIINSGPNPPNATVNNGSISQSSIGSDNYRFNYTPDPGFYGLDTLDIGYWSQFQFTRKGVVLSVIPSKVIAENDYATTPLNTPVVINVLDNDYASRNNLTLSGIPIVSNGNAVPDNNSIVFIPENGFEGIAHFNYIACDDIGTCANGTVSISVIGNSVPQPFDTTYLATAVNTVLPIPLNFDDYLLFSAPNDASATFIATNVIEFDPDNNFVGLNEFTLRRVQNGSFYYKTFIIDVLSSQDPNGVAFDDYAYTPVNTPIEINVAQNDLGNYNIKSFTQSDDGLVEKIAGKVLRFTPDLDFDGIASFTYRINVGSHYETATVFVTVDNQTPSSSVFELNTIKNVPKPIYYNIPINEYSFSIADQADHGTVNFYEGYLDTLIYGQVVTGHNLVIYTPDVDFVGVDEFEVLYCVNANNQCQLTKILMEVQDINVPSNEICISDDCVWPGDGNNDGIVNMIDLLFLGYSFGDIGDTRINPTINWYGQFAQEWNKSAFPGSVDSKFTDMNGDGIISADDLPAMDACYNLTHNLTPEYNTFAKNYPYSFVPRDTIADPASNGYLVEFDIILGNSNTPIIDLTGFTFSFDFNPAFIDPNSIQIDFDQNNFFNFNSPSLDLVKSPWLGRVDVGYTRTNGFGVSGYGKIGTIKFVSFIIEDDVDIIRTGGELQNIISIVNPIGMDSQGRYIEMPETSFEAPLFYSSDVEERVSPDDLTVYPTPSSGIVNLKLDGYNEILNFNIYSISGKALVNSGKIDSIAHQMDLSHLIDGIYILRVQTTKGVITKKIQIVK